MTTDLLNYILKSVWISVSLKTAQNKFSNRSIVFNIINHDICVKGVGNDL